MPDPCERCGKKPRHSRKRCPECDNLVCSGCWSKYHGVCNDCKSDFYYVQPRITKYDVDMGEAKECWVCDSPLRGKKRKCGQCGQWVHYPKCWNRKENCCKDCW